ncbi:hypothetical protein Tsubulata_046301, partial [Turnera subulata]
EEEEEGRGPRDFVRELLRFDTDLTTIQDNDGWTPLHWAASKGRVSTIDEILSNSLESAEMITRQGETVLHLGMVVYLLKLGVDVNAINRKGHTALDVVESDVSNSGALVILPALQNSRAKRGDQVPPGSMEIQQIEWFTTSPTASLISPKKTGQEPSSALHHHRRSHRRRRHKQLELQTEGLCNACNTITVVAVLIATVTFAAGINPPGGFDQKNGYAIKGTLTSFKVFVVYDIVALFLSLGIVIFLVSIVPFRRKSMIKLLVVTHKVMWLSTSFLAAAYIAA